MSRNQLIAITLILLILIGTLLTFTLLNLNNPENSIKIGSITGSTTWSTQVAQTIIPDDEFHSYRNCCKN
jgi:hypothetical protein